ncbi:hypothetical protein [Streptosporangium sandarakinum]
MGIGPGGPEAPERGAPDLHAWNVAKPGGPDNWPSSSQWEEGFDLTEADDAYVEPT